MKWSGEKLTHYGLGFILTANVIDIFFTIKYIFSGVLQEANPIMEPLVEHPFLFIALKTALVCGGVAGLYSQAHKRLAQLGTYFCFSIYFALVTSFWYFMKFAQV